MFEELKLTNLIYKILILLLICFHKSILKYNLSKNNYIINDIRIKQNISNFQKNKTSFDYNAKEQYIRKITFIDNNTIEQNISNFKSYIEINIDNQYLYEGNIDFSNYTSELKVIAFYSPKFILTNDTPNNSKNEWSYVLNAKPLFSRHNQPRKPGDEINYLGYYDISGPEIIKKQIELAKSHGIFGFAILLVVRQNFL